MIRLSKSRFKRLIVVLMMPLLVLSSVWGTLYISVHTDATLESPEEPYSLQLMSADYNPDGDRILQKDGGMHRLNLGSWVAGTNKTYPAAFAIVNPSDRSLTIENLSLEGAPKGIQVYLHRNMSRPSNEQFVNINKTENSENTTLHYDDGVVEGAGTWELKAGSGYNESGGLIYENGTDSANATKENGVWTYDFDSPLRADDSANFVWVEISLAPSAEMESDIYRGPIDIEIEAEFEDGPSITFMGAGRREGGPAIQAIKGNSIELNVTDLKKNTTVVIPNAVALVNPSSSEFKVTGIEVSGDSNGYMQVHLHGDPNAPAGDYDLPVDKDSSGMTYYDGTANDHSGDGWILSSGLGYDEDSNLIYGNESANSTATRTAGHPGAEYNLWMYDSEGNNTATEGECNFVWVEIAYVIPDNVGEVSVDSTITFQFSSV